MRRKTVQIILPIFILLFTGLIFGYAFIQADEIQLGRAATAVGSAFTYQGRLNDGGTPATGNYDFQFALYDDVAVGSQVGSTINQTLAVSDGLFTTSLDFGDGVFDGGPRYLDISVKLSGGGGYTSLTPRQAINATPYASYADKVQPLANVVNVAKSGGDFTSVSAALASITDASASNPYVIRIAPGIYEESVDMKSYVDLEGSGEGVTVLRWFGSNGGFGTYATLRAVNIITSEIRFLTVESNGTGNIFAGAIYTSDIDERFKLTHVTAVVSNATLIQIGIENVNSSPSMNHVTVSVSGGELTKGIYNDSFSSPTMNNITVNALDGSVSNYGIECRGDSCNLDTIYSNASGGEKSYGIYIVNSSKIINDVIASGSGGSLENYGVLIHGGSPSMNNVTAKATGGDDSYGIYITNSTPTMKNIVTESFGGSNTNNGMYNLNSHPRMDIVTASATGGDNNYGVRNINSSPTMNNVTTSGSNGLNNSYGVYNESGAPRMYSVIAKASGALNKNRGVYNIDSNPIMDNVQASTSGGGTSHIGVLNEGSSAVTIQDSTLQGGLNAILNGGGSSAKIANTLLDGTATIGGGLTCVGAYDETFVALDATCQ